MLAAPNCVTERVGLKRQDKITRRCEGSDMHTIWWPAASASRSLTPSQRAGTVPLLRRVGFASASLPRSGAWRGRGTPR